MDKSEGKDWFAKTLNSVTEETAKVYKISRLKLEINSLNKAYNEKIHKMSRQLLKLIEEGKVDASLFEPEYTSVVQISEKISEMEKEIEAIKNNINFSFGRKKSDSNENKTDDVKETDDTSKKDDIIDVNPEPAENDEKKENNENK